MLFFINKFPVNESGAIWIVRQEFGQIFDTAVKDVILFLQKKVQLIDNVTAVDAFL